MKFAFCKRQKMLPVNLIEGLQTPFCFQREVREFPVDLGDGTMMEYDQGYCKLDDLPCRYSVRDVLMLNGVPT